jgi:hypothetical protein
MNNTIGAGTHGEVSSMANQDPLQLAENIKKALAALRIDESLLDQVASSISKGEIDRHAGDVFFALSYNGLYISQLFMALAVKIFKEEGYSDDAIDDLLNISKDLDEV